MKLRNFRFCIIAGIILLLFILSSFATVLGSEKIEEFNNADIESCKHIKDIFWAGAYPMLREPVLIPLDGISAKITQGASDNVVFGFSPEQNGTYELKKKLNKM